MTSFPSAPPASLSLESNVPLVELARDAGAGADSSVATIQTEIMKFACNLLASDLSSQPSILGVLSELEAASNARVQLEEQKSYLYEQVLSFQIMIDRILAEFLKEFWGPVQGGPIVKTRHRFRFPTREVFTHEYALLEGPNVPLVFESLSVQLMHDTQIEIQRGLESWSAGIGSNRVLYNTMGHYLVKCTGWKAFHEDAIFVCEYDVIP
jgi:hypothetical protein